MNKRILLYTVLYILCSNIYAQKIDFNLYGRNENEGTEPGYTPWAVVQGSNASLTLSNGVIATLSCDATQSMTLRSNWWKQAVTSNNSKIIGDCVAVYGLDAENNTYHYTDKSTAITLTLKGLSAGEHSILAYHNVTDGAQTSVAPINVAVNGNTLLHGVAQTSRELQPSNSGQSYIKFTVTEGENVTITYSTVPESGSSYTTTCVFINALIFDQPNPKTTALDPSPATNDMHVDADNGTLQLSWVMATSAVKNHLYIGTSEENMQEVSVTTDSKYTLNDVYSMNTYYWRVDQEDAEGNVYQGEIWKFRPRQLAFPGAEGYGRFATGGRGGIVYHVTSLDDDADNPQPGTLRYGITQLSGPRTIVFDVAGVITLQARLAVSDPYVTIAGQTAPGTGIMLRGKPFGVANESITQFIRMRLGGADDWDGVSPNPNTADGLGMAGNDHSIIDHCSVGWTIDEAFSSRNAKNVTLQRTLISEALNIAGHANYEAGKGHGYAATIGGNYGTYHHNLLAHNEGRNWSMSGGLDGSGAYAGHHDMFNNVCYNWGNRTTDGGTHQGQFVNNYYKAGPATTHTYLLTADLEGTGTGTQSYYVKGNIRENINGTLTGDALNVTYRQRATNGQVVNWDVFVDQPFFESYATIEPAKLAFKTVLSDVGCNQPFFDNHDTRMVKETLTGTTSTQGSRSKLHGIIDKESDAEGFDGLNIVEEYRTADWDSDQDGMPDWWEKINDLDPKVTNNNDDTDRNGYTELEEYLHWISVPHYTISANATKEIDLTTLFAGFDNAPTFEVVTEGKITATVNGTTLKITPTTGVNALYSVKVTANDADNVGTMTRTLNFYADTEISSVESTTVNDELVSSEIYTINGTLVRNTNNLNGLSDGVYIIKETRRSGVNSYKILHKN